jgi:hypothetical protein
VIEVNRKISVVGVGLLLIVLFLAQTSAVYAAKSPIPKTYSTYFFSEEWQIDHENIILNDKGTPQLGQREISGIMKKDWYLSLGTFTCVDTFTYYYDRAGAEKYTMHNQVVVITTSGGTLTVNAKFKLVSGVAPEFQRLGSWVAVSGTGRYASVSARGEYRHPFIFSGTSNVPDWEYGLDVNIVGPGSVTKSPDLSVYPVGTVVTLTAVPDSGAEFKGWSGSLTGNANPATITMNGEKTVTATFELVWVPYP